MAADIVEGCLSVLSVADQSLPVTKSLSPSVSKSPDCGFLLMGRSGPLCDRSEPSFRQVTQGCLLAKNAANWLKYPLTRKSEIFRKNPCLYLYPTPRAARPSLTSSPRFLNSNWPLKTNTAVMQSPMKTGSAPDSNVSSDNTIRDATSSKRECSVAS